jgi:hypothetical protein
VPVWFNQRLLDADAALGTVGNHAVVGTIGDRQQKAAVSKRFDKGFSFASSQVHSDIDIPSGQRLTVVTAAGCDHGCAQRPGDLNRQVADSPRCPMHEHRLAGAESCHADKTLPRGKSGERERGGFNRTDIGRNRGELV